MASQGAGSSQAVGSSSGQAQLLVRRFEKRHNMVVPLDPSIRQAESYQQILHFLLNSRICQALTANPKIYEDRIQEFWRTARYDCIPEPPVIRARVDNTNIAISVDDIRAALGFGNVEQDDGPTEYCSALRIGTFRRMGYSGDLTASQFVKSYLIGQWRS